MLAPARAYEEEVLVAVLYVFDERSLVHVVAVFHYDILKVLHAVRYALAVYTLFSFSYCHILAVFAFFWCKGANKFLYA